MTKLIMPKLLPKKVKEMSITKRSWANRESNPDIFSMVCFMIENEAKEKGKYFEIFEIEILEILQSALGNLSLLPKRQ